MTDEFVSFGYWVRRRRMALDLTQQALASQVGCAAITIRKIEQDERRPSRQMAERLADCLVIPAAERDAFIAASLGERPPDALPLPRQPIPPRQHNLPHYLSAFIGRTQESETLQRQLQERRLITLVGPGGSGKTRLAVHVGWQAVRAEQFPDGVWLAELAELDDPGQLASYLAQVLNVPAVADSALYENLYAHLSGRRLLLILDNCEHLIEECARLAERLLRACPDLVILATSREPLRLPGEMRYPVPPLNFPDTVWREANDAPENWLAYEAVSLFCERATAVQPTFCLTADNMTAVALICRYLDGVPLALELAAACAAQFSPAEIARRLPQALGYFTGGSRAAPARQQTLRAAVAWSYDLLSDDARRLLPTLAVFSGSWTLEAAEFVSAQDGETFRRSHTELVDKSLVAVRPSANGRTRYELLEMIRQFAQETRPPDAEDQRRHFAYFHQLLCEAEPAWATADAPRQLERLAAEQSNLRAALLWAQATNQPEFRPFAAARGMLWYMQTLARMDEQAAHAPQEAARLAVGRRYLAQAATGLAELAGNPTLAARLRNTL